MKQCALVCASDSVLADGIARNRYVIAGAGIWR